MYTIIMKLDRGRKVRLRRERRRDLSARDSPVSGLARAYLSLSLVP